MAGEAWILYQRGNNEEALALMSEAADPEDSMDKHPTTPGEVLPVRELYGELLLKVEHFVEAQVLPFAVVFCRCLFVVTHNREPITQNSELRTHFVFCLSPLAFSENR